MLTKFWESVGTKLADRLASVTGPALLFGFAGLLLWMRAHGGFGSLDDARDWLSHQGAVIQVLLAIATLAVVIAAGVLVQRLTPVALRLLEGYWPAWARRPLANRATERYKKLRLEWGNLAPVVESGKATSEEWHNFAKLDTRLRRLPTGAHRLMPTRVGNVLRAAETRPRDKYGLDGAIVWPALWLLLPESTRDEVRRARAALDASVAGMIWALLSLAYTIYSPWMLLAAPATALLIYHVWVIDHAKAFADLVEASFDLYRHSLYTQLRWPLPKNPAAEFTAGQAINAYLLRGARSTTPSFESLPAKAP